jgi:hypothetical protein
MTTAMLRPVRSGEHRTTRPWHLTRMSRSDPSTSPGIATVNSTAAPTLTSVSLRNKIPPAEISIVSARCSSVVVLRVTGRCNGKRIAFRRSGCDSGFMAVQNYNTSNYILSEVTKVPPRSPLAPSKSHFSPKVIYQFETLFSTSYSISRIFGLNGVTSFGKFGPQQSLPVARMCHADGARRTRVSCENC